MNFYVRLLSFLASFESVHHCLSEDFKHFNQYATSSFALSYYSGNPETEISLKVIRLQRLCPKVRPFRLKSQGYFAF
jgi:hypothetical protein